MTSYSSQYFGSAKPIVNQTNAGVNSLVAQINGGGGGGSIGPNPVFSSITTNGVSSVLGGPDIFAGGPYFLIYGSSMADFVVQGDSLSQVIFQGPLNSADPTTEIFGSFGVRSQASDTDRADMNFEISTINKYLSTFLPGSQTYLEIQCDSAVPAGGETTGGSLELGAYPDGRCYIGAGLQNFDLNNTPPVSSLMLIADGVYISSLNVSSINGATPGGGALPEDASFNTLGVSSISVSSINMNGFPVPLITYGANQLDGNGTATIGLDHIYTIPYYPFVTYKATLPANTSTLSVSTINGESFAVFGEANMKFNWMVVGN